jgi:hypothetical protein
LLEAEVNEVDAGGHATAISTEAAPTNLVLAGVPRLVHEITHVPSRGVIHIDSYAPTVRLGPSDGRGTACGIGTHGIEVEHSGPAERLADR